MAGGFLGIFAKRDKSRSPRKNEHDPEDAHTSSAKSQASASILDPSEREGTPDESNVSGETDYVLADSHSPTLRNSVYKFDSPSPASSSKLKIPFRRRKQSVAPIPTASSSKFNLNDSPPRPAKSSTYLTATDPRDNHLRPPPSRSAIFASHGEPHDALSIHSLPHNQFSRADSLDSARPYETMSNPDPHTPSAPPPVPPKKSAHEKSGGMFAWARSRERTKSKPARPSPAVVPPSSDPTDSSFNLKSFRHINASPSVSASPLPERPPSSLSQYTPPVRPRRPREDSLASDSSQRISVAAFREAQARRSAAVSPTPSYNAGLKVESPIGRGTSPRLSPGDMSDAPRGRNRSSTVGSPASTFDSSPIGRGPVVKASPTTTSTPSTMRLPSGSRLFSDSSSEETSESEASESDAEETLRPTRKRTIRQNSRAQSELGHRSPAASSSRAQPLSSPFSSPSPSMVIGQSPQTGDSCNTSFSVQGSPSGQLSAKPASPSLGIQLRKQASVSESALVGAAGKRAADRMPSASPAAPDPKLTLPPNASRPRLDSTSSTTSSESSESDSSDDVPLTKFMPPPRPGSAMSASSNGRRPAKPLIDINELTGNKPMPLPRRTLDNADLRPQPPPEPLKPLPPSSKTDDEAKMAPKGAGPRSYSLGIGERLAHLASGVGSGHPNRSTPTSSADPSRPPSKSPNPPAKSSDPPTTKSSDPPTKSPSLPPAAPPRLELDLRTFTESSKSSPSSVPQSAISPTGTSQSSSSEIAPPIKPTPIREREPAPSFAVTSRPISHASSASLSTVTGLDQIMTHDAASVPKSTVRIVKPSSSKAEPQPLPRPQPQFSPRAVSHTSSPQPSPQPRPPSQGRPSSQARIPSTTLVTRIPKNDVTGSRTTAPPPPRPFTGLMRENSPASSTGDSSSGRMPQTPRDGSELGAPRVRGRDGKGRAVGPPSVVSSPTASPGALRHRKRASVTFEDETLVEREGRERERKKSLASTSASESERERERLRAIEDKRRERRRTEAKASIELGRVINGTGPLNDDDDDDVDPMTGGPRMNMNMGMYGGNPTVPFPSNVSAMGPQYQSASAPPGPYPAMPNMGMNMNMGMGMPMQGQMDPMMIAAHQHAMMIAKQTYQMAVAQQAMREAGDQWELGSNVSGWGGGGQRSSVMPNMNMGMNGMGVGGMNMGMFPPMGGQMPMGGWPGGGMMFPQGPRSMYAGSAYAPSEVGGGSQWGSRSVYGDTFGPSDNQRSPRAFRQSQAPPVPAIPSGAQSAQRTREGPRVRTKTAPSGSAPVSGQPARRGQPHSSRPPLVGAVSPPSSWKPT